MSIATLVIHEEVLNQIVEHARHAAPLEDCGYLGGPQDPADAEGEAAASEVLFLPNIDASPEHFSFAPKDQFAAIRTLRQKGLTPVAVWHSHPASPARPSAEDIRLAFDPNTVYVIVSLVGPVDIRAWHIERNQGLVAEISVRRVPAERKIP